MKITQPKLIQEKVTYTIHGDELYFVVSEIKELYPEVKFPLEKVKKLRVKSIFTDTIRAQDIEEMTDFDKKVVQFMKAKPKE